MLAVLEGLPIDDDPVIDIHAHILHTDEQRWHIPKSSPRDMVKRMDRFGIDIACVSALGGNQNDLMLNALDAAPGRLYGFVCINPRYSRDATEELERCFQHPMVKGIGELHPTSYHHDYPITGEWYTAVWEFASKHGVPVLVHSGPKAESARCGPRQIGEIASSYARIPLIIGHAGGYDSWDSLDEALEVVDSHDNVYLDISAMARHFGAIEYMARSVGSSRILLGTDAPLHDWSAEIAHVACSRLDVVDKQKILGANAKQILAVNR